MVFEKSDYYSPIVQDFYLCFYSFGILYFALPTHDIELLQHVNEMASFYLALVSLLHLVSFSFIEQSGK